MLRREFLKALAVVAVPFRMAWGAIAPTKSASGWQTLKARIDGWDCEVRWQYCGDESYRISWLRMSRPAEMGDHPAPKLFFKGGKASWLSWNVIPEGGIFWEAHPIAAGEHEIIHDETPIGFYFSIPGASP